MTSIAIIIFWFLVFPILAQGIMVVSFVGKLAGYQRKSGSKEYLPSVTVILCLRGSDPFLSECISALLRQEYPLYDVKIVLDQPEDPARDAVLQTLSALPSKNITLNHLEQKHKTCSLKCSGILQALSELDPSTQVVALLDADTIAHKTWLRELVAPLADQHIGVTTGYRWYSPASPQWGSIVRYLWNAAAVVHMRWHRIPWGGSLAFRTRLLHNTDLLARLRTALSEDTILYEVIRPLGLKVKYVSSLVMVNREVCSLKEFFFWVRRQLLATRLYHPVWNAVLAHGIVMAFVTLFAVGVLVFCLYHHRIDGICWAGGGLIIYQSGLLLLLIPLRTRIGRIAAEHGQPLDENTVMNFTRILPSCLILQVLYPAALISTVFMRRINWRNITYRIDGPWKIRMESYHPYESEKINIKGRSTL